MSGMGKCFEKIVKQGKEVTEWRDWDSVVKKGLLQEMTITWSYGRVFQAEGTVGAKALRLELAERMDKKG